MKKENSVVPQNNLLHNVATWLSVNHPVILSVDHDAYQRFKESLGAGYTQVFKFLEVIRYPYEKLDDKVPEDSTPETFTRIIQNLTTKGRLEPFSQVFVKQLDTTLEIWQIAEADYIAETQHAAPKKQKRDDSENLEAATQRAMAAALKTVTSQPSVMHISRRQQFFADPQQDQTQAEQKPQDNESKATFVAL